MQILISLKEMPAKALCYRVLMYWKYYNTKGRQRLRFSAKSTQMPIVIRCNIEVSTSNDNILNFVVNYVCIVLYCCDGVAIVPNALRPFRDLL